MTGTENDRVGSDATTVRLFAPPPPRRRWSAGDLLRLLIGLSFAAVGLFAASFAEGAVSGVESDVVDAIDRIPNPVEQAVLGTSQIIAVFVPIVVLGVVLWSAAGDFYSDSGWRRRAPPSPPDF